MSTVAPLHFASVIVQAVPTSGDAVEMAIRAIPEADVFARESGKIVAVIESADERRISEVIDQLNRLDGVLSASLVFHQTED